ncbi:hypothetical protein F5Y04DRAFT_244025 [Hypomontagnella monticulosa]|nr:hypothetical protein F5Y04DRAFT_244025 [Hypomontagnella monticulosa]
MLRSHLAFPAGLKQLFAACLHQTTASNSLQQSFAYGLAYYNIVVLVSNVVEHTLDFRYEMFEASFLDWGEYRLHLAHGQIETRSTVSLMGRVTLSVSRYLALRSSVAAVDQDELIFVSTVSSPYDFGDWETDTTLGDRTLKSALVGEGSKVG